MKAQASLFIIVGLVVLITVGILVYVTATSLQTNTQPEIQTQDNTIQQCLEAATDVALQALARKGVINGTHNYILEEQTGIFRLGTPNYAGLCDRDGPNPRGDARRACTPNTLYPAAGRPSIQQQLKDNLTQEVRDCADLSEAPEIEVLFQTDNLVVRAGNTQYTQSTPLTSTWAAIHEFVINDTSRTGYFNGTPIAIKACEQCQTITVTNETPGPDGTKVYAFSAQGEVIARITAQNRGIAFINQAGFVSSTPVPRNAAGEYRVYSIDNDLLTSDDDDLIIDSNDHPHYTVIGEGTISDPHGKQKVITS